jgi:DNA-binding transcriptional LysR family regulator
MARRFVENFRLRELAYIVDIAATESIRKSAARHNIGQPRLSKIVHDIESEVGDRIFRRAGNKTVPTALGAIFIAEARQALASIDTAKTRIERSKRGFARHFHVGGVPNPTVRLIGPATLRTIEAHGDVTIEVTLGDSEGLIAEMKHRRFNLVIARAMNESMVSPLRRRVLYPEMGIVVARPGHPLAGRGTIDPTVLGAYPWVMPRQGPTRNAIELAFLNAGINPPQPFFVNYDLPLVTDVLCRGDALAVISRLVASPLLKSGQLAHIDVGIGFNLPSYAVYSFPEIEQDPVCSFIEKAIWHVAQTELSE